MFSCKNVYTHEMRLQVFASVRLFKSRLEINNSTLTDFCFSSMSQEILLGALKPFTRYELAIQSNGISTGGPFSSTVEESTLADSEY